MITEDYVSFEIAKLLKEKGFDELCYACYEYFKSNVTMYSGWPFEYKGEPVHNTNDRVKCPTHQMAMKWLREVHNIHISVDVHWLHFANQNGWMYIITKILENGTDYIDSKGDENDKHFYSTYEEACETAIKYCLENLI